MISILKELWEFLKVRKKIYCIINNCSFYHWKPLILLKDGNVPFIYIIFRMYVLGISAYYHDSASALIKNGQIVAAAQEERFTRKKHDNSFPKIQFCIVSRS